MRDSDPPSRLIDDAGSPGGHEFFVDVAEFQLVLGKTRGTVPATPRLRLSDGSGGTAVPIVDGEGIVYAIAAAERLGAVSLIVQSGAAAATGQQQPPGDADIQTAVESFFVAAGDDPAVARIRAWCFPSAPTPITATRTFTVDTLHHGAHGGNTKRARSIFSQCFSQMSSVGSS